MPFIKLTPHIRQRIHELRDTAKTFLLAGHESLAWAYRNAAMSLRRGDETTAEYWLEKADFESYALKPSA
ncbi:MAG: hypothetical protein ABSE73_04775 [Planctomycetota bacterium]